ncbi:MAG: hypothetical protein WBK20_06405 [Spirochaetota bacterium]
MQDIRFLNNRGVRAKDFHNFLAQYNYYSYDVFMDGLLLNRQLLLLIVLGTIFGIFAAIAAFVNVYNGYSHFPNISKTKRIRISLSIALGAFIIILVITIAILVLNK